MTSRIPAAADDLTDPCGRGGACSMALAERDPVAPSPAAGSHRMARRRAAQSTNRRVLVSTRIMPSQHPTPHSAAPVSLPPGTVLALQRARIDSDRASPAPSALLASVHSSRPASNRHARASFPASNHPGPSHGARAPHPRPPPRPRCGAATATI